MRLNVATVQMTTDDRDQIDEVAYRYPLLPRRRPSMSGVIARAGNVSARAENRES